MTAAVLPVATGRAPQPPDPDPIIVYDHGHEQRMSALSPLLQSALSDLPVDDQTPAAQIALMSEMGFKDMEIAKRLGMSWRALEDLRERLRGGVVRAMGSDYSEGEIVRTLGIGTARVRELGGHA
jgi:hypothetical protein